MADEMIFNFIPDLQAKVEKHEEVMKAGKESAEEIAEKARSMAPVETGAYRDGIKVLTNNYGSSVVGTDPKSPYIEFGAPKHNLPGKHILRNAAGAAGFKLGHKRKKS